MSNPYVKVGVKVKHDSLGHAIIKALKRNIATIELLDGAEHQVNTKTLVTIGEHCTSYCSGSFNNHNPLPGAIEDAKFAGPGTMVVKDLCGMISLITKSNSHLVTNAQNGYTTLFTA